MEQLSNPGEEIVITDKTAPKKLIDQVKVFNLFAFFGGDALRVASAAQCDVRIVEALAHDFCWLEKIKGRNRLDTVDGLKAEQENNRAANYDFAKRLMGVIQAVAIEAATNPDEWAMIHCVEVDGETGEKTFNPKPLVELSKAAEIAQNMTYRALGDKIAAKADTAEAVEGGTTNLMINVYNGLDKLARAAGKVENNIKGVTQIVRDQVVDATIEPAVQ